MSNDVQDAPNASATAPLGDANLVLPPCDSQLNSPPLGVHLDQAERETRELQEHAPGPQVSAFYARPPMNSSFRLSDAQGSSSMHIEPANHESTPLPPVPLPTPKSLPLYAEEPPVSTSLGQSEGAEVCSAVNAPSDAETQAPGMNPATIEPANGQSSALPPSAASKPPPNPKEDDSDTFFAAGPPPAGTQPLPPALLLPLMETDDFNQRYQANDVFLARAAAAQDPAVKVSCAKVS